MSTPTKKSSTARPFFAFLQESIRNRLTAIVVGAAIVPVVLISIVLGWSTYVQVRNALTQDAFDKLSAVQSIKANQITSYLSERQSDMLALANMAATLREDALTKLTAVQTIKKNQIESFFAERFADVNVLSGNPNVGDALAAFEASGAIGTSPDWQAAAQMYGPWLKQNADSYGYADIFLVSTNGNVLYTVAQESDLGQNLLTGELKTSPAGLAFQAGLTARTIQDFGAYAPSANAVALFVAAPIKSGGRTIGVLMVQVASSGINTIMHETAGLGETGETYLVGPDKLFRSDSRFVTETTILNSKYVVDTVAVNAALAGNSGNATFSDYRGIQVLSVYTPVNVPGLNWVLLAEIDVTEAFVPRLTGQEKDFFTQYKENYGYYDIFLINPDGYIFYTVSKEADYQTNILTGVYKDSNLGSLTAEILGSKAVEFADFAAYAPTGGKPAAFFGIPLLGANNQVEMIVAAQASLDQINAITGESTGLGTSGETYLVGPDQLWRNDSRFLTDLGVTTTVLNENLKVDTVASRAALAGESGQQAITDYRGKPVLSVWSPVDITESSQSTSEGLRWALIAEIDQTEALAPVAALAGTLGLVIGLAVLVIGTLAVFLGARFAIQFVTPIISLTNTATQVAAGNMNLTVETKSLDEFGTLSNAFNTMTAQLRDMIGSLESRVAERTRNLELAGEVGRTVSQVRALDVMLRDAAELIRKQFDLYYVQVYLTDPSQTNLILQSGTGTVGAELVGRGHRLPLDTASINGRAAVEKKSVVISNTTESPTFKPNPLLPDTRSEMAVPLLIGNRVVGVLDMQSIHAGSLNRDVLSAFEAMAGQLAIAIQNANFLAETDQARAEVETQARRLTRANWVDYMDAIHKPEEIGFVFEKNQIAPMTQAEQSQPQMSANALSAPIAVTGEALGNLVVEMEGGSPIARTDELINTVAQQVARQIESLRLLESAERYRFEAEEASRRITRAGWQDYMDANTAKGLSFIYDLKEVRQYNQNEDQQVEESDFSLPLKVHDETVGKLSVLGLKSDDKESLDLVNAVAERLGAHIEGLRLSKQTEEALASTQRLAQREQALRQITSAVRGSTDPATILRSAVRELGAILGRKTIVRLATAEQARQTDHPADLVGDSAATGGNESLPPAESQNAVGGDQ